jgi:hypothetical protein
MRGIPMTWQFWKSKEEQLKIEWDNAVDARNQGKWLDAAGHFAEVERLSNLATDPNAKSIGPIAKALSTLCIAKASFNPDNLFRCYRAMSALDPRSELEIPYNAKAGDIAQEMLLFSNEASLPPIKFDEDVADPAIADKYEAVARSYLELGREQLATGGLFDINKTTMYKAMAYMGRSRVIKARAAEGTDPSRAIDYYSEAIGYFSQIDDKSYISYLEERSKKLINMGKCWFCGRLVQGEEVNFVYLKSFSTPYFWGKFDNEAPPVMKDGAVIACKACFGAMSLLSENIAERISKMYFDRSMEELKKVHDHLESEINSLEREVSSCRGEIGSIRVRVR